MRCTHNIYTHKGQVTLDLACLYLMPHEQKYCANACTEKSRRLRPLISFLSLMPMRRSRSMDVPSPPITEEEPPPLAAASPTLQPHRLDEGKLRALVQRIEGQLARDASACKARAAARAVAAEKAVAKQAAAAVVAAEASVAEASVAEVAAAEKAKKKWVNWLLILGCRVTRTRSPCALKPYHGDVRAVGPTVLGT